MSCGQEHIHNLLRVHVKDDIDSYWHHKSGELDGGLTDAYGRRREVHNKMEHNVKVVMAKIHDLTSGPAYDGTPAVPNDLFSIPPLHCKLDALIRHASDPRVLATVDVSHMTWF